jgi:hypothetical protein
LDFILPETDAAVALLDFILRLLTPWTWSVRPEPVPVPVQQKSADVSKTTPPTVRSPEPVQPRNISTPAPVQVRTAGPPAAGHAQALLERLHSSYAGRRVRAVDVKGICYPQLLKAMGWRARPWDGRDGVGHHLGRLTGGRTFGWFEVDGERKRQRGYHIPVAITVRKRA